MQLVLKLRLKIFYLLLLGASLVACAPSGDTETISPFPSTRVMESSVVGIVPGALHNDITPLGYVASSTIGESTSGISQTTPLGYKAYSAVEGNIASQ